MSQHDYVIANDAGASVRSDLNSALGAAVTQNSGAAAPSTTFAYMLWADTANAVLKQRNAANNAWIDVCPLGILRYWNGNKISGLTLSNNGADAVNDIDIAAGACADLAGGADAIMALGSALTKRLDAAWAVGTGNGGLDTGAVGNTTYHVWLIKRPDTGVVDALFSTSASAPTMPTNYTIKRRIGSFVRNAGANDLFTQMGDEFLLKTPVNSFSVNAPGTSAVLRALSIPSGLQLWGIFTITVEDTTPAGTRVLITSPDQTDTAPSSTVHDLLVGTAAEAASTRMVVRTNTSAQVRTRALASDAGVTLTATTHGWIDRRGQDS